ncbi:MAG TPA: hypothetical protein VGI43_11475 [Mucilaginibacter sp.]
MEQLPNYIGIVFILTAILTILLFYKAANNSKPVIIVILSWLTLQSVISLSGFYTITTATPPRFPLLVMPPMLLIVLLFFTKRGKQFIDGLDIKILTLLHVIRVPVEITLFWLFSHKAVPVEMTFEGRNFDILCGITAPFVYYFGYVKGVLNKTTIIAWNIACVLLLANTVVTAVLSAPSPFQRFGFDQPNIALFHFPFVWLPSCLVPIVFLANLAAIRKLIVKK